MNNRLYGLNTNSKTTKSPTGHISDLDSEIITSTEFDDPRFNNLNNQLRKKFSIFN